MKVFAVDVRFYTPDYGGIGYLVLAESENEAEEMINKDQTQNEGPPEFQIASIELICEAVEGTKPGVHYCGGYLD
jgi:hypothetical protein